VEVAISCMMANVLAPRNGRRPVAAWYKTQPSEKMSERSSTIAPCVCSGGHIRNRTHDRSGNRDFHNAAGWTFWVVQRPGDHLGDAEVENLDLLILCHHDIRRFDITVHDTCGVCSGQR